MYLGRDDSKADAGREAAGTLQFGPRCIWGETNHPLDWSVGHDGGASIRPQMYLGRDKILGSEPVCSLYASIRPQMYLGRDAPGRQWRAAARGASIRPQMYLGRDEIAKVPGMPAEAGFNSAPDVSGERLQSTRSASRCSMMLQFGPRCIWGETPMVRTGRRCTLPRFNSAPDVSGERPRAEHRWCPVRQ